MIGQIQHAAAHAASIQTSIASWHDAHTPLQWVAYALRPASNLAMVGTTAVLLTLTSPRNIHLSDRSRANVNEAFYHLPGAALPKGPKLERLDSLIRQNRNFDRRYVGMSSAFLLLVFSMIGFLLAAGCAYPVTLENVKLLDIDYRFIAASGVLSLLSFAAFTVVLFLLCSEFMRGPITLKANSSDLKVIRGVIASIPNRDSVKVYTPKPLIRRAHKVLRPAR